FWSKRACGSPSFAAGGRGRSPRRCARPCAPIRTASAADRPHAGPMRNGPALSSRKLSSRQGAGTTLAATLPGTRALIQSAPANLRRGASCALVWSPLAAQAEETAARRCHAVRRANFDLGLVPARRLGGQAGDGRALGRVGRGLGDRR